MDISKNIRRIYKTKGLTIEKLALKLGLTQSGLSRMLTTDDFKVSTLEKIAKALDVPVISFFDDKVVMDFVSNNIGKQNKQKDIIVDLKKQIEQLEKENSMLLELKNQGKQIENFKTSQIENFVGNGITSLWKIYSLGLERDLNLSEIIVKSYIYTESKKLLDQQDVFAENPNKGKLLEILEKLEKAW